METLDKYSNKNPFKVPEGYFENFEENLIKKTETIDLKDNPKWKITSLRPYLAIAAGFILIFAIWGILLNQFKKSEQIETNITLKYDEIHYLESVSTDEMIEMVSMLDISIPDNDIIVNEDTELIIDLSEDSSIINDL